MGGGSIIYHPKGDKALKTLKMTNEDRKRFHELLDYALDTNQEYVLYQFARMDLQYNIHKTIYRMRIKKEEEDVERCRPQVDNH